MNSLRLLGLVCACAFITVYSTLANAAPIQFTLDGSVTAASGSRTADLNTAFYADLIFDLDAANAYAFEVISPTGEPPFPRWTFSGSPYQTVFSGNFGYFVNTDSIVVETVDNFDADANGNPFGITGIVDVLTIQGSGIIVDCSNGTVDPITGCDDPNAPWLSGQEFQVNLVGSSGWFSGMVLPASIPDFNNLIGVFGQGEFWSGGASVGEIEVTFTAMNTPSANTFYYTGTLQHIFVDNGTGTHTGARIGDSYSGQFSDGSTVSDGTPVLPCLNDECEYEFSGSSITTSISDGTMTETGTGSTVAIWDGYDLETEDATFINMMPGISWTVGTPLDGWLGESLLDSGTETGIGFISLDTSLYSSLDYRAVPPDHASTDLAFFTIEETDAGGNTTFLAMGTLDSVTSVPVTPPSRTAPSIMPWLQLLIK